MNKEMVSVSLTEEEILVYHACGLSPKAGHIISSIFAQYPQVLKVVIYGSRAKATYRKGSDIDMTILDDESLTRGMFLNIVNDFEESLLPYLVDLSLFRDLQNQDLVAHINRYGKIIYTREGAGTAI